MELRISAERAKALEEQIERAKAYYHKVYKAEISDEQVIQIIKAEIAAQRHKLFMKQVGVVSDADLDYLQNKGAVKKPKAVKGGNKKDVGTEAQDSEEGREDQEAA